MLRVPRPPLEIPVEPSVSAIAGSASRAPPPSEDPWSYPAKQTPPCTATRHNQYPSPVGSQTTGGESESRGLMPSAVPMPMPPPLKKFPPEAPDTKAKVLRERTSRKHPPRAARRDCGANGCNKVGTSSVGAASGDSDSEAARSRSRQSWILVPRRRRQQHVSATSVLVIQLYILLFDRCLNFTNPLISRPF